MPKKNKWSCLFMLAPMSDRYVDFILGALKKLDTSAVSGTTEKLGTLYTGSAASVMDGVMACFALAEEDGIHMTMEAVFEACAGEQTEETEAAVPNEKAVAGLDYAVNSRFAVYAGDGGDARAMTERLTGLAQECGVYHRQTFGRPALKGAVKDVYAFYRKAIETLDADDKRFVLSVTMSVNSPSPD